MISKSNFLRYKQCPKAAWLYKHKKALRDTSENDVNYDRGRVIGELAQNLMAGGTEIEYSGNFNAMAEKTKQCIENGIQTIYEATFIIEDVLIMCDILTFNGNGWELYEVKSSVNTNSRHLDDLAFQYYVLKACGIHVLSANLVNINNKYVRDGALNIQKLFKIVEYTDEVLEIIDTYPEDIRTMKTVLNSDEPKIEIDLHCDKYCGIDFICEFKSFCFKDIPEPSVFSLGGSKKAKYALYHQGYETLDDIPEGYKLNKAQAFQLKAYKEDITIVDVEAIQNFLKTLDETIYFLDFETFMQDVPEFDGIRPYQKIPFQYSLHIKKENQLTHLEFLGKEGEDPRRALAERLVADIPMHVCTLAYNMGFEKGVIKELAMLYDDLSEHLLNINEHMKDIMIPFQKKWYYTKEMQGSYSIKYVLPALCPNDPTLDYKALDIQNGSMAMNIYASLHLQPKEEIKKIRKGLLAYCKLDTLAMVKIWEVLTKIQ